MSVRLGLMPDRFPATGAEAAVSITRAVTQHRLGMRLRFDGRLDADRLASAALLSLDAEPVLGCSFATDEFRAYWRRLSELDSSDFSLSLTSDPESEMDAFQAKEVPDAGPQAAVILLRTPDCDEIGIKVSHVVADGQAAKQYAYLLADIYTRLGHDLSYAPEPNLDSRPTFRDVWEHLTPAQRRGARKAKSWSKPTWQMPSADDSGTGLTYRTKALDPRQFASLKDYGRQRKATVNDMMLAAVFRACVEEFDPPQGVPHSLMCTADLRRYLPNSVALPIANVSISGSLDIERVDGESFESTLARVCERMAAWASTSYGAAPALNAERLQVLGYRATKALLGATFKMAGRSGRTYPFFTNIGVIDDARLSFDGAVPVAGHMYGPVAVGASIVPVVSTYRDTLTVCMGFCESDFDAEIVERVLASIFAELSASGCLDERAD